ncbi:hypothetical protein ANN_23791 [Periplaneta americana]|uniref:Uncharacterized protein n=1 Tax=Periplaneta americana TaxID=6978 RepID=A0ABQ8SN00_PERAM|nr:hypothetical protein ANN_23791 [Periplaneta americana]
MSTAVEDVEALFAEVGQVQKELEKFDVKRAVDANEIYELLETHSFRTDRVQFVTTHLLVTLGLRNHTEDVIDVSDDSYDDDDDDDDLDDVHYTSSPEYPILNEPAVLDLSMSDSHPAEEINFQNDANENVNNDTDNIYVNGEAQNLPAVLPSLPFYDKNDNFETHETDIPATADNSVTENNVMIPSATVESTVTYLKTQNNTDTSSVDCIPRSGYQSEDFICDVNNNDPNNNTEYDVTLQPEVVEEHNSFVREMDDSGLEFEDQDEIRCKLLDEAKLIHRIVPRQNLEQIYSFLEANLDRKNRVQIVMQEFLRMELSDPGDIVTNDSVDSSSKDTNHSSNIILKRESLLEPCTSSKENMKVIKNAVEMNVLTGSQQCTSTNTKALESLDIESLPSTSWCKRTNVTKDISRNMNGGCKMSSTDLKNDDNKKINIPFYEQIPLSHNDLKTSDMKKTDVSEVSSTSVPSEFADQNAKEEIAIYNSGDVGITSTSNLKMCLIRDPKSEGKFAVKSFTQSDTCSKKDENNIETESNHVPAIEPVIPSSSTENSSSDESVLPRPASAEGKNKRKSESVDDYSPSKIKKTVELNQRNLEEGVPINEIVLTENQQKYRSRLMEMFPNADPLYLQQQCHMIETEESLIDIITRLVETDDYPRRQKPVPVPDEPQPGPSDSAQPDEERTEMQYQMLVSILPNADPMYLRENCEKIGNDEDAMKTFVANALEKGDYPTREEYDKRQKALDQRKKYTEQFSVEGFLEVLPDPFKYFTEEKKSNSNIIHHALPFLKGRYKKIRQQDLQHVLKTNSYNLTLTCQQLDEFIGNLRRSKRSEYECRIPAEVNVPFLQEVSISNLFNPN